MRLLLSLLVVRTCVYTRLLSLATGLRLLRSPLVAQTCGYTLLPFINFADGVDDGCEIFYPHVAAFSETLYCVSKLAKFLVDSKCWGILPKLLLESTVAFREIVYCVRKPVELLLESMVAFREIVYSVSEPAKFLVSSNGGSIRPKLLLESTVAVSETLYCVSKLA